MTSISFVYTFYNNQPAVDRQCRLWNEYPDRIKKRLCIIVIDDCSTTPLEFNLPEDIAHVHLRVTNTIIWNQPGAKNLAMKFVPTEWTILTDSDHFVTAELLDSLLAFSPVAQNIYFLGRNRSGQPCNPHPNSFLLRKNDFFAINGYDEDFCGHYGHDDHFFTDKAAKSFTLSTLEQFVLENDQGLSTPDVVRKHRRNKHLRLRKLKKLHRGTYRPSAIIRFNWEIVSLHPPLCL